MPSNEAGAGHPASAGESHTEGEEHEPRVPQENGTGAPDLARSALVRPPASAPAPAPVTLRSDLRASAFDGSAALAVTAVVFAVLYARIEAKTSSTVTVMPFMADTGAFWMYFLSQAFGWSALLWAWGTVVLGLLLSGPRPARLPLSGPRLERLHRTTSLNTIALIFAHALLFAAELIHHSKDSWLGALGTTFVEVFVPGGYDSGTGRIAIPVGQAALYLALPLGLLFYVRHRIGPRTWRAMHRFVLVVYVLSVWHTLLYGTNVWYDGWFRTTVWLLQLPIAALFLMRLLRPARRSQRLRGLGEHPGSPAGWSLRLVGRVAAVGIMVVLLAVIITGRDGGRVEPPPDTTSTHNHD
ncbi:ferric reductase-like transmembrane domain-containing protein [Streptomyces albipurpureus]|uniref:Ferric reductase-like transmembrane domain-containing protein n=1 Tax=Streptomyces albipurpureus TaxID=2897419 RepID=A0ABT0UKH2_9ACTN|nr:ferric reductase-like transmembrane domain-containing protein [Streptomyces sp. CWNU-1]MCM2389013.1 ferric reductase-like transmembrane domain-containing protein [Streptomyces sp. CWNU-1]